MYIIERALMLLNKPYVHLWDLYIYIHCIVLSAHVAMHHVHLPWIISLNWIVGGQNKMETGPYCPSNYVHIP